VAGTIGRGGGAGNYPSGERRLTNRLVQVGRQCLSDPALHGSLFSEGAATTSTPRAAASWTWLWSVVNRCV